MECHAQPTSLLSVPKVVSDLLLSYLTPAEGGLQSILNLRVVCSTTKGWIDDLLPCQRKKLFWKCEANLELTKEGVEAFLKYPSPLGVTSLRLMETSDKRTNPELDEKLWNSFISFWSPRLLCLHLDGSFYRTSHDILKFCLSCRALRSLKYHKVDHFRRYSIMFATFLSSLEEIRFKNTGNIMHRYAGDEMSRSSFYNLLAMNEGMKNLEIYSATVYDLSGIIKVIDANRENPFFKLKLGFDNIESCENLTIRRLTEENHSKLMKSVAASKSIICVVNLGGNRLRDITQFGRNIERKIFFEKVEMVCDFNELRHSPSIAAFPNLKEIGTLCCSRTRGLNSVHKLKKLERLGITDLTRRRIISSHFLPNSLTHLDLKDLQCSPTELIKILNLIARSSQHLTFLSIEWTLLPSAEGEFQTDLVPVQPPASFSCLTTFKFKTCSSFLDKILAEEFCRMVLLDGLGISQLSLRYFHFSIFDSAKSCNKPKLSVFDCATLTSLIAGRLAKSLLVFLVDKEAYTNDAAPLVMKLKTIALSNKKKRMKTHGLRHLFTGER